MKVQSGGVWRYPDAYATERDGTWWIVFKSDNAQPVILGDVVHAFFDSEPFVLKTRVSLHEALGHLRGGDNPEATAGYLVDHFRTIGAVELCRHGLPLWHAATERRADPSGRTMSSSCIPATLDDAPAVRVKDIQTMLACWSRIENAPNVLARGHGLSPKVVADLLAWPILPTAQRKLFATAPTGVPLSTQRSQQLISLTVTALMTAAGLSPVLLWEAQQRPGLGMRANTTVGLYAFDLIRRLGRTDVEGTYLCDYCQLPYTPRRRPRDGERRVCIDNPACRRAKSRDNTAAHRARQSAEP